MRGALSRERFPKSLRLRKRADFVRIQGQGKKVEAGPLLALCLPSQLDETRIGFTVSSKVGNAVERARLKRILRELFRKRRGVLPRGLDVVLIAKTSAKEAEYEALAQSFDAIAVKLKGLIR